MCAPSAGVSSKVISPPKLTGSSVAAPTTVTGPLPAGAMTVGPSDAVLYDTLVSDRLPSAKPTSFDRVIVSDDAAGV